MGAGALGLCSPPRDLEAPEKPRLMAWSDKAFPLPMVPCTVSWAGPTGQWVRVLHSRPALPYPVPEVLDSCFPSRSLSSLVYNLGLSLLCRLLSRPKPTLQKKPRPGLLHSALHPVQLPADGLGRQREMAPLKSLCPCGRSKWSSGLQATAWCVAI